MCNWLIFFSMIMYINFFFKELISILGDIVGLYPNKGEQNEIVDTGIISFVRAQTIGVAFNEDIEGLNLSGMFRLMKLTNDVTYRRLNK